MDQWHLCMQVSAEGDIYRSKLDNRRIVNDLDWVPKYSFQQGLAKTYDWFLQKHTIP